MRLNLGAVLHVTHAYVGAMVDAGWGRVVTVVSDAGRKGERMQAIYGSAKSGAMGFTRGLAAEVGAQGVTANCVSLGTMKTGAFADALDPGPVARAEARPALPDAPGRGARRSRDPRGAPVQRRRRAGSPARCTRSTAGTSRRSEESRRSKAAPAARPEANPTMDTAPSSLVPELPVGLVLRLMAWLRADGRSPRAPGRRNGANGARPGAGRGWRSGRPGVTT